MSVPSLSELCKRLLRRELMGVKSKNMPRLSRVSPVLPPLILEEFVLRRKRIEDNGDILCPVLEGLKWMDERRDGNRFDDLCELFDKSRQGFAIVEEHEDKKIPTEASITLQAQLLDEIEKGYKYVKTSCEQFYERARDHNKLAAESADVRFLIRHLDSVYSDLHVKFLRAYLGMDWRNA